MFVCIERESVCVSRLGRLGGWGKGEEIEKKIQRRREREREETTHPPTYLASPVLGPRRFHQPKAFLMQIRIALCG